MSRSNEKQEGFIDLVCSLFESEEGLYEVVDRNDVDPFEPDLRILDRDEWAFNVLCYHTDDIIHDGVLIFPKTFDKRKWVLDRDDDPTFLALGVGGTPSRPEHFYFTRFMNVTDTFTRLSRLTEYELTVLSFRFLDHAVEREFERIFSPS